MTKRELRIPTKEETQAAYEARLEGWMCAGSDQVFMRPRYKFALLQTDDWDFEIRFRVTARKKARYIDAKALTELAAKLGGAGHDIPMPMGDPAKPKIVGHVYRFFCGDKMITLTILDMDDANKIEINAGEALTVEQLAEIADKVIPYVE